MKGVLISFCTLNIKGILYLLIITYLHAHRKEILFSRADIESNAIWLYVLSVRCPFGYSAIHYTVQIQR